MDSPLKAADKKLEDELKRALQEHRGNQSVISIALNTLLVSLAVEGKFSAEGLQGMNEGEDILMAMARELVNEKGIGESAAATWKRLQQEQQEVFGVRVAVEPMLRAEMIGAGQSTGRFISLQSLGNYTER